MLKNKNLASTQNGPFSQICSHIALITIVPTHHTINRIGCLFAQDISYFFSQRRCEFGRRGHGSIRKCKLKGQKLNLATLLSKAEFKQKYFAPIRSLPPDNQCQLLLKVVDGECTLSDLKTLAGVKSK